MATETELKFQIPPDRLAALRRALVTRAAQVEPLAAAYFDTPGQHLAQARMALRLRREGDAWVQTLKAAGGSALHRLEDNHPVPGVQQPVLDLDRHAGSEAGAALRKLLQGAGSDAAATLQVRYATEVRRTRRVLRSGGAAIELALDEGRISAGAASLPLCEIEFELLSGPPQALLALAGRWAARFGLVLDMRSKSERGHNLAVGLPASPPAGARALRLASSTGAAAAVAAMVGNALQQVLANASQIAGGPAEPEHLHQLRVGLRRLRSVAKVYAPWLPADHATAAAALAVLFRRLGARRDQDALAEWLWPALAAAGAPVALAPPALPPGGDDPAALLRAPATQQLWLTLLGWSLPPDTPQPQQPPLRRSLAAPLHRLHRQLRRDARGFDTLDAACRHRLRRRIKRLRYLAELTEALWPADVLGPLLKRLRQAQAPLGALNDTQVALAQCRQLAEQDPRAWFAVGWLTARHQTLLDACGPVMSRLAATRSPWRKR